MSRFVLRSAVAAAFAMLAMQVPAQAATVTYNMTLTGGVSGTGSFTIDTPTGILNEYFTVGNGLHSLNFSFATVPTSTDFNLAGELGGAQVFFQNGNLAGITYMGFSGAWFVSAFLNAGALSYVVSGLPGGLSGTGVITASLAPPEASTGETPLPGAVFLFGSVLAGAAGIRKWRNRRDAVAALAAA